MFNNFENIVFINKESGHRKSYGMIFSKIFNAEVHLKKSNYKSIIRLLKCRKLIFATIDDNQFMYVIVVIIRIVFRKYTIGLLLNPSKCFDKKIKTSVIRKFVYRVLKSSKFNYIYTIIPYYIDERNKVITNDWIYDPQFWDITNNYYQINKKEKTLSEFDKILKTNKPILTFLGGVSKEKGFEFLYKIITNKKEILEVYDIVIAGNYDKIYNEKIEDLKKFGVRVYKKYITDYELYLLLNASNIVWGCYNIKYDLSSGIFGRAIQLEKKILVRENSIISRISKYIKFEVIDIKYDDIEHAYTQIILNNNNNNNKSTEAVEIVARNAINKLNIRAFI